MTDSKSQGAQSNLKTAKNHLECYGLQGMHHNTRSWIAVDLISALFRKTFITLTIQSFPSCVRSLEDVGERVLTSLRYSQLLALCD